MELRHTSALSSEAQWIAVRCNFSLAQSKADFRNVEYWEVLRVAGDVKY